MPTELETADALQALSLRLVVVLNTELRAPSILDDADKFMALAVTLGGLIRTSKNPSLAQAVLVEGMIAMAAGQLDRNTEVTSGSPARHGT